MTTSRKPMICGRGRDETGNRCRFHAGCRHRGIADRPRRHIQGRIPSTLQYPGTRRRRPDRGACHHRPAVRRRHGNHLRHVAPDAADAGVLRHHRPQRRCQDADAGRPQRPDLLRGRGRHAGDPERGGRRRRPQPRHASAHGPARRIDHHVRRSWHRRRLRDPLRGGLQSPGRHGGRDGVRHLRPRPGRADRRSPGAAPDYPARTDRERRCRRGRRPRRTGR